MVLVLKSRGGDGPKEQARSRLRDIGPFGIDPSVGTYRPGAFAAMQTSEIVATYVYQLWGRQVVTPRGSGS